MKTKNYGDKHEHRNKNISGFNDGRRVEADGPIGNVRRKISGFGIRYFFLLITSKPVPINNKVAGSGITVAPSAALTKT